MHGTEHSDGEGSEGEDEDNVLDFSGRGLQVIQLPESASTAATIILDNNNISRLEGLEICNSLTQVSRSW